eukprot:15481289-Alexandrium_andersonii.AAC.2
MHRHTDTQTHRHTEAQTHTHRHTHTRNTNHESSRRGSAPPGPPPPEKRLRCTRRPVSCAGAGGKLFDRILNPPCLHRCGTEWVSIGLLGIGWVGRHECGESHQRRGRR